MRIACRAEGWLADRASLPVGRGTVPERGLLLAQVATLLRRSFAQNFAVGGRPSWEPLTERTMREKMRLYLAGSLRGRKVGGILVNRRQSQPLAPGALFSLIRTGALRNAAVRRGAPGNVTKIDAQAGTVEVGVNLPYGGAQNYGNPERNLPARPFLSLTDEDADGIADWYAAQILGLGGVASAPEESEA